MYGIFWGDESGFGEGFLEESEDFIGEGSVDGNQLFFFFFYFIVSEYVRLDII
jgi:hypothetical protein